ncbi:MAG: hypothetical protein IKU60_03175 [Clostridia bacterium]|nr:hypothetical protein [Clostridia bacterium]
MRSREINILHITLTIFIFVIPVILSAFEKGVGVYLSLFLFALCMGLGIIRNRYAVLSKTAVCMLAMSAYSFLSLLWVSDKGCQVMAGSMFLTAAFACLLIGDYKYKCGNAALGDIAFRLIYSASLFYSVIAVLHQIFIESSFIGCSMDLGKGSPDTGAFIAVFGIVSALRLFGNKKRQPEFYVAVPIFAYVLLMTKSFMGYLFAFAVAFAWCITRRHKKVEALLCLSGCAVMGIVNAINAVAELIVTKNAYLNGAIKGLVSVLGIGCGGYNATCAVTEGGYEGFPSVLSFLTEAYGIIGVGFVIVALCGAVMCCMKRPGFINLVMLMLTIGVLLSSSEAAAFTIPLIAMYYTCREDGVIVYIHRSISVIFALVGIFALLFASSHIPYAIADHNYDMGRFDKAGRYYEAGARMEMISSYGWERAYKAYMKEYGADENALYSEHRRLIRNAIKFNKKNYGYYRDMAKVYTAEGDYIAAMETWENIILRHDKEVLYPSYAEKIYDVMANCPVGLDMMGELYTKIDTYAKKATDRDIIFEMNNILARSQTYYINVREGVFEEADMYEAVENMTEAEYESGNTES